MISEQLLDTLEDTLALAFELYVHRYERATQAVDRKIARRKIRTLYGIAKQTNDMALMDSISGWLQATTGNPY